MASDKIKKELNGVGGWLIWLMLTLIFNTVYFLIKGVGSIYWLTLPTEVPDNLMPLVYFEIIGYEIFTILLVFCNFLFFYKKKIFIKWYIYVALSILIFHIVEGLSIQDHNKDAIIFDKETLQSLADVLIWAPYLLLSKRVKATFTR